MTERKPRRPTERQCSVCGQTFTATRYDASTCGPTCRTRAARATRTGLQRRLAAERAVQSLIDQTTESGDAADLGALRRLRRLIDEALTADKIRNDQRDGKLPTA